MDSESTWSNKSVKGAIRVLDRKYSCVKLVNKTNPSLLGLCHITFCISSFFMQDWAQYHGQPIKGHGIAFANILLSPRSKGYIRLRANDPFEYPVIDPNYLSDEADLDRLVEGECHFLYIFFKEICC
jgi:hypothetical protein